MGDHVVCTNRPTNLSRDSQAQIQVALRVCQCVSMSVYNKKPWPRVDGSIQAILCHPQHPSAPRQSNAVQPSPTRSNYWPLTSHHPPDVDLSPSNNGKSRRSVPHPGPAFQGSLSLPSLSCLGLPYPGSYPYLCHGLDPLASVPIKYRRTGQQGDRAAATFRDSQLVAPASSWA